MKNHANESVVPTCSVKELASLIEMPRLLEVLGFAVAAGRHRCSCLIHGGKNRSTFSWSDDGRWFCFSCGRGGDRVALVMAVKQCCFSDALTFLATIAGVKYSFRRTSRSEMMRLVQKRQHATEQAWHVRDEVVRLRGVLRDRLLRSERLQHIVGERLRNEMTRQNQEQCWDVLARLAPITTFFLAYVNFLNDADFARLIRFGRASNATRIDMIFEGEF